jgi:hypothetical protein
MYGLWVDPLIFTLHGLLFWSATRLLLDNHVIFTHQVFTEISLTMKIFPYLIRLLVFCPWPTAAPTLTAVNSSSRAQKQTGEFLTLYFALLYAPLVIRFIRLDNKHVVFGKVIDGMLTVRLRCHKELFVSVCFFGALPSCSRCERWRMYP